MKIYNIKESVAPATTPVTSTEAKLHCRVDHSADDTIFTRLIEVARRQCEQISGWAFVTRTYTAQLDAWPRGGCIELPNPPLQSVTSIAYTDDVGGSHTIPASDYVVDTHSTPGRIVLKDGATWPSETLQVGGAVTITFVAGFGDADDVPEQYKQAMLLLIGHLYENRESVVVQQGVSLVQVPMAVDWLLRMDGVYY